MSPTYSLRDLARLTRIPARSIRAYIKEGILPRPRQAGPATLYGRDTLGALAAIRTSRREVGAVPYDILKKHVASLEPDEIEDWAETLDPLSPPIPEATTSATPDATPTEAGVPAATRAAAPLASATPLETAERWLRVPLVPGLDLMMLEGSGELVARLAREIQTMYRATRKMT